MTFEKALQLMKQRKRVRRAGWDKDIRCFIPENNTDTDMIIYETDCGKYFMLKMDLEDILADDWENYKESLTSKEEKTFLQTVIQISPYEVRQFSLVFDNSINRKQLLFGYNLDGTFVSGSMYVDDNYFSTWEVNKPYTLKELGLDEA